MTKLAAVITGTLAQKQIIMQGDKASYLHTVHLNKRRGRCPCSMFKMH